MGKYENKIKKALNDILAYVGADPKYAEYAQLVDRLEWLLKECGIKDT